MSGFGFGGQVRQATKGLAEFLLSETSLQAVAVDVAQARRPWRCPKRAAKFKPFETIVFPFFICGSLILVVMKVALQGILARRRVIYHRVLLQAGWSNAGSESGVGLDRAVLRISRTVAYQWRCK